MSAANYVYVRLGLTHVINAGPVLSIMLSCTGMQNIDLAERSEIATDNAPSPND